MFEFAVQSPTRIRLRIGRLHLRTWKSHVMLLPRGYRDSDAVYSVMDMKADGKPGPNIGTFYTEAAAKECMDRLRAEGWGSLVMGIDSVYYRVQDWEFDR